MGTLLVVVQFDLSSRFPFLLSCFVGSLSKSSDHLKAPNEEGGIHRIRREPAFGSDVAR